MLEMRFAGLSRFIAGIPADTRPDNLDFDPERQATSVSILPDMPVSGVNWTRHQRPKPKRQPPKRPSYLKVVK